MFRTPASVFVQASTIPRRRVCSLSTLPRNSVPEGRGTAPAQAYLWPAGKIVTHAVAVQVSTPQLLVSGLMPTVIGISSVPG